MQSSYSKAFIVNWFDNVDERSGFVEKGLLLIVGQIDWWTYKCENKSCENVNF